MKTTFRTTNMLSFYLQNNETFICNLSTSFLYNNFKVDPQGLPQLHFNFTAYGF